MKAKVSFVSALAAAALISGVGTARAAGDPRIPWPNEPSDIPSQACGFGVLLVPIASNEYIVTQTTNADGSVTFRITGRLVVQLTNDTTAKSITVNASGAASVTIYPDNSAAYDVQGLGVDWLTPDAQNRFGLPGLGLFSGHTTATIDSSGTVTSWSTDGQVTDLCAALK